jgi:putative ABC transport system permease protein
LAGALIGIITGFIHVKLKVRDLLAGIIMMTALYSVNLRILGKANLPIYNNANIFNNSITDRIFSGSFSTYRTVIIVFVILVIVKMILDWYMNTKSGYLLKAVGDNELIVTAMGIDEGRIKILGLAIANGLVSLAGCIYAQQQRYCDVTMGTGTAVIGLASVIIGTSLFKNVSFMRVTTSVVIGSIIYKGCVALAIRLGLRADDLKLVTATLFLIILVVSMDRKKKAKIQEGQA